MGLLHTLAQQFRQPSGLLGRLVGLVFRINREGNDWTVSQLEIQATDHVLEVGFGSGYALTKVAELATHGWVAGVDFSTLMVRRARRRNAASIWEGRMALKLSDASSLPYQDSSFHKAFAANVIYFWSDPMVELKEIRRVLKPGGRLAIYIIDKKDLADVKLTQTGVFKLYTADELALLLAHAGFLNARATTKAERWRTGICAIAEK